ncbi:MAG: hypothetical protein JWN85_189 [Gammaproteobacteria bacterium]|nr:hypothetical protein [Gammaproteobacteria bacterium]
MQLKLHAQQGAQYLGVESSRIALGGLLDHRPRLAFSAEANEHSEAIRRRVVEMFAQVQESVLTPHGTPTCVLRAVDFHTQELSHARDPRRHRCP